MSRQTIFVVLMLGLFGTIYVLTPERPPTAPQPTAAKIERPSIPEAQASEDTRDFDSVPDGPLFYDFANWMATAPGVAMPETPERRRQLVEIWRTASPQLRRYQELGHEYNADLMTAAAIHECGFRDAAWWSRVEHILRQRGQVDPALVALRQHLSRDEIDAARAYQTWGMAQHQEFTFGRGRAQGCADMEGMPFVSRFDNLR